MAHHSEATVNVSGSATGFVQQIVAGSHRLIADEPLAAGGTDRGPGPYELLLAALGACTSMTISMYARRKAWPLENVSVELRHEQTYLADCEDCEKGESLLSRLHRVIELTGPLSAEQRSRLLEIANKCPVHRTLTSKIEIETRLAGGD
jgi:putative redox protein